MLNRKFIFIFFKFAIHFDNGKFVFFRLQFYQKQCSELMVSPIVINNR